MGADVFVETAERASTAIQAHGGPVYLLQAILWRAAPFFAAALWLGHAARLRRMARGRAAYTAPPTPKM